MKTILLLALACAAVATVYGSGECTVEDGLNVVQDLWTFQFSETFAISKDRCCDKCNAAVSSDPSYQCVHYIYRSGSLNKNDPQNAQSACWLSSHTITNRNTELFHIDGYSYGLPNRSSSSSSEEDD